ncbi:MAG: hypothetical protein AABO41_10245 [Acidobacteriota bacterium]
MSQGLPPQRRIYFYLILLLFVLTPEAPGQAANWRRSVSTDRRTGERTTSVTTTSVNTVKSFGRTGRGTLTVSSYETMPGLIVHTFIKVSRSTSSFAKVESWYDDDSNKSSGGVWTQPEDQSTTITHLFFDIKDLLKAKSFSVSFTGGDGEKHLLTFRVQGLAQHLNFLEIRADKK